MSNEEIERTIQQMLAVQRELQERQIATTAQIQDLREQIQELAGQVQNLAGQVQSLTNLGAIILNNSAEVTQQLRILTELVTNHENRLQRLETRSEN